MLHLPHVPMASPAPTPLGALVRPDGVLFRVWAPEHHALAVVLERPQGLSVLPLAATGEGFFEGFAPDLKAGARYRLRVDGAFYPDPASRYQPDGVHGPSEVVDPATFLWRDADWQGVAQDELVFYELHVGTFTAQGTFEGVRERLPYLRDLCVTALELMPVADFPGRWNWGYDPAALYAPSRAYGTPDDLRALVDAAHNLGIAVFLDVVYNHLGPDGAYLAALAPLFTDRHQTPWGRAINLDDAHSEGVRNLFIDNALSWLREFHLDGLRLDATHALADDSPRHFLAELAEAVATLPGHRRLLIAEDHRNLNALIRPRPAGYGLDGVWVDDFHHQVRNLTAGDTEGYYAHYAGTTTAALAETLNRGWYFDGRPSPATGQPRGTPPESLHPWQSVFCIQNHDQVGNRPLGNRLSDDVAPPLYRAASALLLFAPELPLLFMGQEWATKTPFLFFTDHADALGRQVSEGRRREFEDFAGFQGEVPDPQDPTTFLRSRLRWAELEQIEHAQMLTYYRDLLARRRHLAPGFEAWSPDPHALLARRGTSLLVVGLAAGGLEVALPERARLHWHSEQPDYTLTPAPPVVAEGRLRLSQPGAALFDLAA